MLTNPSPLQHGLQCADVALLAEDITPLRAHIDELAELHQAITPFELVLVHDLAFASWRRKRAWLLESEFASQFRYLRDAVLAKEYRVLQRDLLAAERLYQAALTRLTRELARRKKEGPGKVAAAHVAAPASAPMQTPLPEQPSSYTSSSATSSAPARRKPPTSENALPTTKSQAPATKAAPHPKRE